MWSLKKQEDVLDFMVSVLLSASVERVCVSTNRISFKKHNGKKKVLELVGGGSFIHRATLSIF